MMTLKHTLTFLMTILILSSCSKFKVDGELIYESEGEDYELELYKINATDDTSYGSSFSQGVMPFSKKRTVLNNMNIQRMMSMLLGVKNKDINTTAIAKEDTIFHNVYHRRSENKFKSEEALVDILNFYDLKLVKKKVIEDFQEIYVEDKEKLKAFETRYQRFSNTKYDSGKPIEYLDYYDLHAIASRLDTKIDSRVIYKGNSRLKYDIKIENSLEKNKELFKKYGLAFRPIKQEVTIYIVEKK